MGHISSFLEPEPEKIVPSRLLQWWATGSRADFPSIPDLNPRGEVSAVGNPDPEASKRGVISEFSDRSRLRYARFLCTVNLEVVPFTMMFTMPGGDGPIENSSADKGMKILKGRVASHPEFRLLGISWKREIQARGALHWHWLIWGLADDPDLRQRFHTWAAHQWNKLLCSGMNEKGRLDHLRVHLSEKNMEEVKNTAYFAKYLGKSCEVGSLPGRWWGRINARSIPYAEKTAAEIDLAVAVLLNRMARKARQKRANVAKQNAINRALSDQAGLFSEMTPWKLQTLRMGYTFEGYRDAETARWQLECYLMICKHRGVRPGKFEFRGKVPKQAAITICGKHAPAFAVQALVYATNELGLPIRIYEETNEPTETFVVDPRRACPPGRQPQNLEPRRFQGEFIGGFGTGGIRKPAQCAAPELVAFD
jgi:hypothetical protein